MAAAEPAEPAEPAVGAAAACAGTGCPARSGMGGTTPPGPAQRRAFTGLAGHGRRPFGKSLLPIMRAIEWAQEQGCRTFDLGGIPLEDDRDPKRLAIAEFKSGISKARIRLVQQHARWF